MIKTKIKPCKSIGISKGFDSCGVLTLVRTHGMCFSCYRKWLLTTKEGQNKMNKAIVKAKEPRKELNEAKSHKREFERLGTLIKNVSIICHKYIRERDKYKSCISCGEPWNDKHQAGHFYKAELFSTLKFNEDNIHGQCQGCNLYKEGNESQYRVNLPKRIGIEKYNELTRLASLEKKTTFKWSRTELTRIRNYYKNKLKL